ncbi:MAG TPA: hypothetical protein VFM37_04990 [Pseudonocardiaceae bacterium]|nr:hypothetical protein [Pseudonocardiaceae bacterium]
MRLTWHDAAATGAVAAAVALYWAFRAGLDLPLVSAPRMLSVVVFILGVTACAAGGNAIIPGQHSPRWASVFGIHGAVAFVLTLLVLITGSAMLLAWLVGLVVLLWLFTTIRHAVVAREPEPERARREQVGAGH